MSQIQQNQFLKKQYRLKSLIGDAIPGERASLLSRLIASMIDGILVASITSLICAPIAWSGLMPAILFPLVASSIAFCLFAIANYKLLASQGQTIGKKLMQLQIVTSDGKLPDPRDVLMKRYAAFWLINSIPLVGPIASLINMLLVFRFSRLAGHDELAGTKVVNAPS